MRSHHEPYWFVATSLKHRRDSLFRYSVKIVVVIDLVAVLSLLMSVWLLIR
jgi:hypothetical protein